MLILARKIGQSITVANNIHITILEINHNEVRLGIRAPRDVPIFRDEIYEKIQKQNQAAAEKSETDLKWLTQVLKTE